MLVTSGAVADCTQALELIKGFEAQHLLADRGYDADAIVTYAQAHGMRPEIPPRKHRKVQREYDRDIYKLRHFVENAFLQLKQWRGIATRYAKNLSTFIATVQIRRLTLWPKIY